MKKSVWLILLMVAAFAGCKKDSAPPSASCRISKLVDLAGKEINITYDEQGRYKTIKNTPDKTTTANTYGSNEIISQVTDDATGKVTHRITYVVGNNGLVNGQKTEYLNSSGAVTSITNTAFEYSGQQLGKIAWSGTGGGAGSITYGWSDGNLTTQISGSNVVVLTYYTDKNNQQADYFNISTLLAQGIDNSAIIKNRSLLKSLGTLNITYAYDGDGKITSISSNGSLLYNVQYTCN